MMRNFILSNIFLLLAFSSFALCLPVDPNAPVPSVWRPIPSHTYPINPSTAHWTTVAYQPAVRTNHSNGQLNLPHFHSGPWDRAWEMWSNVSEKFKIFRRDLQKYDAKLWKRGVEEEIVNHLRSGGWWQRVKDFFKRITGGRLKVTRLQYEEVKQKYGHVSRGYAPTWRDNRRKKNGRLGSAFPTRSFASGQGRTFQRKQSRFGT